MRRIGLVLPVLVLCCGLLLPFPAIPQAAYSVITVQDGGTISLEVADDGSGIAPDRALGLGLLGMRERVAQLGGRLDIASDGGGTKVKAVLPISTEKL